MGDIHQPASELLLIAVSSRYDSALDWSEQRSVSELGPLSLKSLAFDFNETDYYQATMGTELKKQFLVMKNLIAPGDLPRIKQTTNQWEAEYATASKHPEPRPLNLDPGYLTLAKLVLASTKDHAHRLYLGEGIFGEVTLNYRGRAWRPFDWTYPDYRRADYHVFFTECRKLLKG